MGHYNVSMSNHGIDVDIYWEAPYGSTSASVYWVENENIYKNRTFQLYRRGEGTRYNNYADVPFDEYCLYVYKNGTYATQSGWFTIEAEEPPPAPDHFYWYFAGDHGSDPNPNYQIWPDGSTATLMGALPDVAGTTYTVSYNANGGSSTPNSSSSTGTYKHTYWNDDYGDNYSPGSKIYSVSEGNAFTAVWSETRTSVKLANAISRANGSSTRTVTFDANGGSCSTASLNSTATITYTFGGWKANNAGSALTAGSNYTPTGNVTMYASWSSSTGNYSAITLPTPTRTGYTFKGWSTSKSATSGSTGTYTPTGKVTLYATWEANTYTVKYDANGGTGAPSNQTKTYGTNLTLSNTKPTRGNSSSTSTNNFTITGNANGGYFGSTSTTTTSITATKSTPVTTTYTFSKWNTKADGSGTNYNAGSTYSENSAVTLYAQWTPSSSNGTSSYTNNAISALTKPTRANTTVSNYKVTFNANGGTCSTASAQATKIRSYSFGGWATTSTATSANASASYTSATTVYAYWTSSDTGGSVTLPTPTRTGYTFKGWSTSSTATSGWSAGSTYAPTAAITLYATWQINSWTVQYNANGYGTAPSSQTKTYNQALTLRSFIGDQTITGFQVSFNKNGGNYTPSALTSTRTKKQTYWNTNSSGTGTNYSSGGTYSTNGATTLYAIWGTTVNGSITLPAAIYRNSSTETGFKVTFNANGGSCSTSSLTATNTRNYAFNKWAAGSTSGTKYSAGTSFTPTAATTMYATWTETVTKGSITLPTATKSGYTFVGWGTTSGATSGVTGDYTPTGNVTLYAVYSANGYTVTYNANGYGTAPANQTKTHGSNLTLQPFIADQSGPGYTVSFNKNSGDSTPSNLTSSVTKKQTNWNTNSNGTGTNYGSRGTYSSDASTTLYAIWSTINGSVTLPAAITRKTTNEDGYKVTLNANGGVCSETELDQVIITSYTFDKWAQGSTSGTKYAAGASFTPTAATTMYATWTEKVGRSSVDLPTPTRDGYTFAGWGTSASAISGVTGEYLPTSNITLYAIWKKNGSLIHYNNNGVDTLCEVYYNNNGTAVLCNVYYNNNGAEVKI